MLTTAEQLLYHRIHPLKLAVDVGTSVASSWLLWRHQLLWALLLSFPPSVLVTAAMVRWRDFTPERDSAFGRYLAFHMTGPAQAVRLAGQFVVWLAAWWHLGWGIALGAAVIVLGWTWSLPAWRSRSAAE